MARLSVDPDGKPNTLFQQIYAEVKRIPRGKVAAYSQVGARVGGISGRVVGFALAALPSRLVDEVPWQRVINIKGRISPHGFGGLLQRQLLEQEGINFLPDDSIDLNSSQWFY